MGFFEKKAEDIMAGEQAKAGSQSSLVSDHLPLARQISARMKRRYTWVALDDLYSYALLGLTMAANAFDSSRSVPFASYAFRKATFWAIDEMRKDGVLRRRTSKASPRMLPLGEIPGSDDPQPGELPDDRSGQAHTMIEARDLCAVLFGQLPTCDRRLLLLYYSEQLTFKEIAAAMDLSESSVCLRHKALIVKLRRLVVVRGMA
jgi:RNA polymerase sigma factor (sigma-70 family)